ncbi:MAG: ABC transporter permease [Chloroflexi bacterium]|nr:ABC transporter permease [Chloroflexota bacterium]MCL5107992.1 ABC transporter permease [Chloroflexota bacterium]
MSGSPSGVTIEALGPVRNFERENGWRAVLRDLWQETTGKIGIVLVVTWVVIAVLAPLISPYSPLNMHSQDQFMPPSSSYLLGADEFGRDILSRTLWGSRISIAVGLLAVLIASGIGVPAGLLAGFVGGKVDSVVMRICDGLMSLPAIFTGIAVVAVTGPGSINVLLAVAVINVPIICRLVRACTLSEREKEYVEAAIVLGAGRTRIMARDILPNTLLPVLMQFSVAVPQAVILEAGLTFLGLGSQPPDPSWGMMLKDGRTYLMQAPWYALVPGFALTSLVVGLNLLSDCLGKVLDPYRRGLR